MLPYYIVYKDVLFIHEEKRQNSNTKQCETLILVLVYTKE